MLQQFMQVFFKKRRIFFISIAGEGKGVRHVVYLVFIDAGKEKRFWYPGEQGKSPRFPRSEGDMRGRLKPQTVGLYQEAFSIETGGWKYWWEMAL